jgi:hypothetical protein
MSDRVTHSAWLRFRFDTIIASAESLIRKSTAMGEMALQTSAAFGGIYVNDSCMAWPITVITGMILFEN